MIVFQNSIILIYIYKQYKITFNFIAQISNLFLKIEQQKRIINHYK